MCMHTQTQRQAHMLIHKSICTDTRIKTEKKVIHTKDITRTHTKINDNTHTHMQTLIQTAVACIKIVIDKQCFLFPCWSCNVLLFCSCCTTPLSLPLPSLLFLSVNLVLNYPSSPFRLPSSIFTPSTPLASFLPSLTPPFHHLCLFAFASSTPHFSFPFSLCRPRCLQSDTAPYSSGKVFFLLFTQSVCQFVSLSFIIALLHEPAQSHLSLLPF